ncbi:MAG: hypothetical protein ACRD1X_09990 [Vicinamibacteria bacterium]
MFTLRDLAERVVLAKRDPEKTPVGCQFGQTALLKKMVSENGAGEPYKLETITDWKRAGNRGSYSRTSVSDRCVPPERP